MTDLRPPQAGRVPADRVLLSALLVPALLAGLTLVALELYFKGSHAKVRLGLGKGKKLHDKRDTIREREEARDIARALRKR